MDAPTPEPLLIARSRARREVSYWWRAARSAVCRCGDHRHPALEQPSRFFAVLPLAANLLGSLDNLFMELDDRLRPLSQQKLGQGTLLNPRILTSKTRFTGHFLKIQQGSSPTTANFFLLH